ncbi:MAG: hypothetical protein QM758_15595 [Armatimonas sp.]
MNQPLQAELLEMRDADLNLRQQLADQGALFGEYNEQMAALHRRNNERFAEILAEHGWPDRQLVGEEGSEAAWLVLQHAVLNPELMRRAISLLEESVNAGNTEPRYLALATDRVRTLEGRHQVYGTQHDWDESGQISPLPIEDPDNVDRRRAVVGLEPLIESTKRLRARAQEEGELPPADLDAHRRGAREWAQSVGWS